MCNKNTELKASSSDSSYLCCSFCVQTLQKGFRCFFLLDVTQRSWLLLTMILLELSVCILSFTRFFVYWEVLATQPVPAVPESQGSVQQLWAAGTACSRASPFLGGASLLHTLGMVEQGWGGWGRCLCNPRNCWAVPSLLALWAGLQTNHIWGFSYFPKFIGTCEAIPLGTTVSFCVGFSPAKLYIKYVSSDVGSGEQSMYMHMSDIFSYYFWQYVFSAWNNILYCYVSIAANQASFLFCL